jgi:hypothetical protein
MERLATRPAGDRDAATRLGAVDREQIPLLRPVRRLAVARVARDGAVLGEPVHVAATRIRRHP